MDTVQARRDALERAIQIVGSQAALARALGKKQPYVIKWLRSPNGVPVEYCPDIERLTSARVRCEELNDRANWSYVRTRGALDRLDEIIQALVAAGFDPSGVSQCLGALQARIYAELGEPYQFDHKSLKR